MWTYRERLNYYEKLRRSLYEILRDTLETRLTKISLIDSFYNHLKSGEEYSFPDKSELKPKSKKMEKESELYNTFIVIFCEGSISPELRNYIRFFPENRVVKKNIEYLANFSLYKNFNQNLRYFDKPRFLDFIQDLLNVDYALLVQQDPSVKKKNRYALTHFHVKIDWPIADAAEDMAQKLRYISKDLYEKGDTYAEIIQKKFFEYYGLQVMAGGRRSAAIVAAQYLKRIPCISTIYAGSSESRSLTRISERGVSKAVLVKFTESELEQIANQHNMQLRTFTKNYLVACEGSSGICIFQAIYALTNHARPPDDGKLREINPDVNWHTVGDQYILPRPGVQKYPPLPMNWIYM